MVQLKLTDPKALAQHRARADGSAWFLHEAAIDEVQERLKDVNRTFTSPAIVTAHPYVWDCAVPGAKVVPAAETLALEPGAHDLVVHAMCLHWADDPVGQLIQCRRALREDGLLLVATLGGETLVELRAALAQAEAEVMGGLSPRVVPMGEIRDLGALLGRAGLALPVADRQPIAVRYRDIAHLARDLRAMGETNALAARHRRTPPRELFARADRMYRDAFPDGDGIRATFEIVFLTGWAPSDTQQKPLRPGSAQARLADVLGVTELGPESGADKG
ncbi:Methyltransferase domain-containing protein [Jannaschia faecimaris]|uniref:Methyltransferase domain-containing protein n=1 Tax=Jannaschia faecimaris TaxID=1244108 RepID=A0A1H3J7D8_9RHOB|nr:methyltransferase domain-containing protein [Jannaschia faecimaris]SDY35459.1 Methyltransferase domain-containing protein [Jannaschia faecimaris]